MKIESLREVKAKLSKIVRDLPSDRSVVITKNGRPCAVLFPVTKETDLESLLLAQSKDFWRMFDRAHKEGEKKGSRGWTKCQTDTRFPALASSLTPACVSCCLLDDFALFYAAIASAGFPDPVTSLIPHPRPD